MGTSMTKEPVMKVYETNESKESIHIINHYCEYLIEKVRLLEDELCVTKKEYNKLLQNVKENEEKRKIIISNENKKKLGKIEENQNKSTEMNNEINFQRKLSNLRRTKSFSTTQTRKNSSINRLIKMPTMPDDKYNDYEPMYNNQ